MFRSAYATQNAQPCCLGVEKGALEVYLHHEPSPEEDPVKRPGGW